MNSLATPMSGLQLPAGPALRISAPLLFALLGWGQRADAQPLSNVERALVPGLPARTLIAETPWFRFHWDLAFNVHDALLNAAAARLKGGADPAHDACFAGLVIEERSAWDAAVT